MGSERVSGLTNERLLLTARFARALRCAHSFARLLVAHDWMAILSVFFLIFDHIVPSNALALFPLRTMVENRKKHRQNSHLIIHFPTSEGVSDVSERAIE